jgi:hypothetical protein
VVSVNAIFELAVLAIQTGIQASEISYGFEVFIGGFVVMFEAAFVAFSTWTPKVMVIAKFVGRCAPFDFVESCSINSNGLIQTTGSRVPGNLWADGYVAVLDS